MRAAHYLQTCLFLTQPHSHTGVECEVAYKSTLRGATWSKESHMWIEMHSLGLKTTQLLDPRWVAKHRSELQYEEAAVQEEWQRNMKYKFT